MLGRLWRYNFLPHVRIPSKSHGLPLQVQSGLCFLYDLKEASNNNSREIVTKLGLSVRFHVVIPLKNEIMDY